MMKKLLMLLIWICATQAFAAEKITPAYIDEVFTRVAKETNVPVKLLRAICYHESHYDPEAYAHGDGSGNNHAFGICQVLHSNARERGFVDTNCYRDFSDVVTTQGKFIKASREYKDCKLFGVYTNVSYAAKFLREKLTQYDDSWISATAAYNAGAVRVCKTGKVLRAKDRSVLWTCKKGLLYNQAYVDMVFKELEAGR